MRDWNGYVRRTPGRETWAAKWKEWGTEAWKVSRGFASKSEASDFLADKRREYRLRRRGDWDEFAAPKKQPISEHVADFHVHVLANRRRRHGERTEKHADQTKSRALAAFTVMKVRTLADLTAERVERFLAGLLDKNRAMKTRNDYCAVLRQFTRWAVGAERLQRDPLLNIRFLDATADQKRKQTLTWQQVRDLAAAGVQRVLQKSRGRTREKNLEVARRRGLMVVTMFLTGLRNHELAHLQWDWIDHAGRVVTVPFEVTKSGRTEFVPLHMGLGHLLEQERTLRGAQSGSPVAGSDLVVGTMVGKVAKLPRWIVDRVRDDAKWIGLPAIDSRGRVLVLYSMRTSFATALDAAGVPDGLVSHLMRHRPSTVTEEHYVQRTNAMLLDAIDRIPAEAAYVPGLWNGDPRKAPRAMRAGAHECAPTEQARVN